MNFIIFFEKSQPLRTPWKSRTKCVFNENFVIFKDFTKFWDFQGFTKFWDFQGFTKFWDFQGFTKFWDFSKTWDIFIKKFWFFFSKFYSKYMTLKTYFISKPITYSKLPVVAPQLTTQTTNKDTRTNKKLSPHYKAPKLATE